MTAIVLPWLVAIALRSHSAFFSESLGHDLGAKLTGAQESHGGFPGLYLAEFPLAFFPGSLFLIPALPAIWRGRHDPDTAFLLAWIVPGWALFEAVPTKLPHYVLPIYPAMAVLLAKHTGAFHAEKLRPLLLAGAAIVLLYGAFFGLIMPRLQGPFIARTLTQHRALYEPALRKGKVAFAGFHEPSAVLWFGTDTLLANPRQAATALNDGCVTLAYVTPDAQPEFLKDIPRPSQIDTVTGFNIARGKPVTIAVYQRGP